MQARKALPKIAILTPSENYEEDWSVLKADYIRLIDKTVTFRCWTQPGDLSEFDLVSPLIAWGYHRDLPRWLALLDRLEREHANIANPVSVLRWNSDKAYLAELEAAGIATVPTRMTDALTADDMSLASAAFGTEMLVIKPPISGGADGTFRIALGDDIPPNVLGRRMMIQPYQASIAAEGEYSLFYFGGTFSHSIIKRPALGDFRVQDQFGGYEETVSAPDNAKTLALATLAATSRITRTGPLAYARVDMLRDKAGKFRLMELELIEPSLFLRFANDRGEAFANSMLAKLKVA